MVQARHLEERAEHQGRIYQLITLHGLVGTRMKLRVENSGKVGEDRDGSENVSDGALRNL